jgi:hypothetical protein
MLHGIRAALPAEREVVVVPDELARGADQPHDLQHHLLGACRPTAEQVHAFPRRDAGSRADRGLDALFPLRPGVVLQRPVRAVAVRGFELLGDDEHPGLFSQAQLRAQIAELEADRAVVVPDVAERLARENANAMIAGPRGREQLRDRGLEDLDRRHPSLCILMP